MRRMLSCSHIDRLLAHHRTPLDLLPSPRKCTPLRPNVNFRFCLITFCASVDAKREAYFQSIFKLFFWFLISVIFDLRVSCD